MKSKANSHRTIQAPSPAKYSAGRWLVALIAISAFIGATASAQSTYETNITTTNWLENFDEMGTNHTSNPTTNLVPGGWVMAYGDPLPQYGAPLNAPTTFSTGSGAKDFRSLSVPENTQSPIWVMDGTLNSTTTSGGSANFGDKSTGETNRSIGFGSSSPSWIAPTNYLMFGFTNGNAQAITNLVLNYNVKDYELNAASVSSTLYWSYDGTNWTHVGGAANVGPFPTTNTPTFLYTNANGPLASNVVVSINSLDVPAGDPFYLCWEFTVASSAGTTTHRLALDDVNLSFGLGTPSGPTLTFDWPSSSGNWNTAGNWLGNVLPTSPANLIFSGAGGTMNNNLNALTTGSGTIVYMYYSNSIGGSYTLNGNGITTGAGITNDSSFIQTINVPVTLGSDNSFAADNADFIFGGAINLGGNNLFLNGGRNYTFNGGITNAGSLTLNTGATLTLNAANTFIGATTISSGTVQTGNSSALSPNSALTVNDTVDLNSSQTIAALNGSGQINMAASNCNLTIGASSSQSGAWSGGINGGGSFIMAGTGIETFSGANTYSGSTIISNGTLDLPATSIISTANGPLILAGGTFQCGTTRDLTNGILYNPLIIQNSSIINNTSSATGTGANRYLPFDGPVTTSPGATLTIQNIATGNYSNTMCLRLMTGGITFSSAIVFDNSQTAHPSNELNQLDSYNTNGTTQTYTGVISGGGVVRHGSFGSIPGGAGVIILTAQNTYSGQPTSTWAPHGTYLEGGELGFGSSSITNVSGAVVSGPVGTGDLEVTLGDIWQGVFASGGARTIANVVRLNGTTNIPTLTNLFIFDGTYPMTFTGSWDVGGTLVKYLLVSNTALTTVAGSITNIASLNIYGPGTLVFSGNNTYGSATNFGTMLTSGTLEVDSTTGSGVGTNVVMLSAPATLSGTGIVGGAVVGTGNITPASIATGPGTLTLNNGLDLSSGGTYIWELNSNSVSGGFSAISLTGGNLNAGGSATLSINFGGSATVPNVNNTFWQSPHSWTIVSLSGTASNPGSTKFTTILNGSYSAGNFSTAVTGGSVVLNYQPTTVARPQILTHSESYSNPGGFKFQFSASPGQNYTVLANTNLAGTNWVVVGSGTVSSSPVTFTDSSTNSRMRFYTIAVH